MKEVAMRQRSKIITLSLVALGGIGLVTFALLPEPVAVDLATVERGPLAVTVEGTGVARFAERHVVYAPQVGLCQGVTLRAGDKVVADQVLAEIVPAAAPMLDGRTRRELDARKQAAIAAEAEARAAADRAALAEQWAASQLAITSRMFDSGVVERQKLDAARFDAALRAKEAEAARLAIETAARQVAVAQAALGHGSDIDPATRASGQPSITVRAPISGVVLSVLQNAAGPVSPGQALLELGDPASLEVQVELLTTEAVRVPPQAQVEIMRFGGATTLHGRVRLVEPAAFTKVSALGVFEQRVRVVVSPDKSEPEWSSLGDGFHLEARIALWQSDDVVKVNTGALWRDRGRWVIYVQTNGKAELRRVEVGHLGDREAEVLSGLVPGEQVVLYPSERVAPGVALAALVGVR
jgi:HlyD family secretion protein